MGEHERQIDNLTFGINWNRKIMKESRVEENGRRIFGIWNWKEGKTEEDVHRNQKSNDIQYYGKLFKASKAKGSLEPKIVEVL
ncbi:Protein CBG27153 [Caenorhabditis briggsae]|uniref:Protein CBG27153 n=1 Tax=Caenorhabditis briggsae TaxID=6238 RepID=B6IL63_CAEBR|nr:Protein CBG27153 [Caenorhabditis briggsae]CAS00616.1 Protein CBG27153 [Caenorhabditis briggsae]